ncbi:hypothetical protein F4554_005472 [Actinopolymorpha rutila]|uniref:DNA-binding phage zinc finger domain-containing protein n=1 Tax=Actinopolymorpha rutila TaxID=446787 RepID=A0A852ZIQ3_9ACTN|nr:hypothetical protein [Actinopolymorpha rutila]
MTWRKVGPIEVECPTCKAPARHACVEDGKSRKVHGTRRMAARNTLISLTCSGSHEPANKPPGAVIRCYLCGRKLHVLKSGLIPKHDERVGPKQPRLVRRVVGGGLPSLGRGAR